MAVLGNILRNIKEKTQAEQPAVVAPVTQQLTQGGPPIVGATAPSTAPTSGPAASAPTGPKLFGGFTKYKEAAGGYKDFGKQVGEAIKAKTEGFKADLSKAVTSTTASGTTNLGGLNETERTRVTELAQKPNKSLAEISELSALNKKASDASKLTATTPTSLQDSDKLAQTAAGLETLGKAQGSTLLAGAGLLKPDAAVQKSLGYDPSSTLGKTLAEAALQVTPNKSEIETAQKEAGQAEESIASGLKKASTDINELVNTVRSQGAADAQGIVSTTINSFHQSGFSPEDAASLANLAFTNPPEYENQLKAIVEGVNLPTAPRTLNAWDDPNDPSFKNTDYGLSPEKVKQVNAARAALGMPPLEHKGTTTKLSSARVQGAAANFLAATGTSLSNDELTAQDPETINAAAKLSSAYGSVVKPSDIVDPNTGQTSKFADSIAKLKVYESNLIKDDVIARTPEYVSASSRIDDNVNKIGQVYDYINKNYDIANLDPKLRADVAAMLEEAARNRHDPDLSDLAKDIGGGGFDYLSNSLDRRNLIKSVLEEAQASVPNLKAAALQSARDKVMERVGSFSSTTKNLTNQHPELHNLLNDPKNYGITGNLTPQAYMVLKSVYKAKGWGEVPTIPKRPAIYK